MRYRTEQQQALGGGWFYELFRGFSSDAAMHINYCYMQRWVRQKNKSDAAILVIRYRQRLVS
jgi:hypothetical protein